MIAANQKLADLGGELTDAFLGRRRAQIPITLLAVVTACYALPGLDLHQPIAPALLGAFPHPCYVPQDQGAAGNLCSNVSFSRDTRRAVMITVAHIQPLAALLAGILILLIPRLLNYIVAIYLILIGIAGLGLIH